MNLFNRKIERRLLAVCIGSITWETDTSTFLQADDITSAQDQITKVEDLFPDLDDAFKTINSDAATAFTYNGVAPIEEKSIEIKKPIDQVLTDLGTIKTQIGTDGKNHRVSEATKFYEEVRNHLMELDMALDSAITAYNAKVDTLKAQMLEEMEWVEMSASYQKKYSQSDADAKYGNHICLQESNPYMTSLSTTARIRGTINSEVTPEDQTVISARKEYNTCALGQGKKAEDLKTELGFAVAPVQTIYASFDSVTTQEAGLSDDYVQDYNNNHSQEMDVHYYGTIETTDGETIPIFYDANEHNESYYGDWMNTTDAARLFTVVDGKICYLTNDPTSSSNDDTSNWWTGFGNYDVSIGINSDGSPSTDAVNGYRYYNHNPSWGSGAEDGMLYFKTPSSDNSDSQTISLRTSTIQRTTSSNDPASVAYVPPTSNGNEEGDN